VATDYPSQPEPDEKNEGRKRPSRPGRPTSMSQPPLTPLIDVFLFLIIFFLLSCQFHQAEGTIPANLPNTLPGGPGEGSAMIVPDPIRITLTPAGDEADTVLIDGDGRKMDGMAGLFDYFQECRARYGDSVLDLRPVMIKPRAGIRWGCVVDAFNQAVRAGFKQVGVAPSGGPATY